MFLVLRKICFRPRKIYVMHRTDICASVLRYHSLPLLITSSGYSSSSFHHLLLSVHTEFEDTKWSNQNPYIEEELTTQWPKEKKVQKDKQRSTKHTYKTKVRIKTGGELRCSGRVSSSCSNSDTRHVNIVTNPVIDQSTTCYFSLESLLYYEGKNQNKRIPFFLFFFLFLFSFFFPFFFLTIKLRVGAFFFQIESSAAKVSMLYNPGMTNTLLYMIAHAVCGHTDMSEYLTKTNSLFQS